MARGLPVEKFDFCAKVGILLLSDFCYAKWPVIDYAAGQHNVYLNETITKMKIPSFQCKSSLLEIV